MRLTSVGVTNTKRLRILLPEHARVAYRRSHHEFGTAEAELRSAIVLRKALFGCVLMKKRQLTLLRSFTLSAMAFQILLPAAVADQIAIPFVAANYSDYNYFPPVTCNPRTLIFTAPLSFQIDAQDFFPSFVSDITNGYGFVGLAWPTGDLKTDTQTENELG